MSRELVFPHWRSGATDGAQPPDIRPFDVLRCADLRGLRLEGLDLTGVTFFGCRLNGTSFAGSRLSGSRFNGCFSDMRGHPTRLPSQALPDTTGSHLYQGPGEHPGAGPHWPAVVTEAAWRAMTGDNTERYRAVRTLARIAYSPSFPLLGGFLDDEEWDVRIAALNGMRELLEAGRLQDSPGDGNALIRIGLRALGDANSLVTAAAADLGHAAGWPAKVLRELLEPVESRDDSEILLALRSAITLSRQGDPASVLATAFDAADHQRLLDLADPEVREEYLHVLGVLDVPLRSAWEKGLGDPSEAVRVAALSAARLLSTPLPSGLFEPLLADPAETARIETIFTLGHAGGFDRDAVERSLTDPSAEVRRLAAELLAGTDRE
ncbi:hypothetical protein CVV72_13380 [Amycolatopsis sp. TNS106]|nr:hypothetical protein CVV72_13380 [Amycolatopsis sp. TNS106]